METPDSKSEDPPQRSFPDLFRLELMETSCRPGFYICCRSFPDLFRLELMEIRSPFPFADVPTYFPDRFRSELMETDYNPRQSCVAR